MALGRLKIGFEGERDDDLRVQDAPIRREGEMEGAAGPVMNRHVIKWRVSKGFPMIFLGKIIFATKKCKPDKKCKERLVTYRRLQEEQQGRIEHPWQFVISGQPGTILGFSLNWYQNV